MEIQTTLTIIFGSITFLALIVVFYVNNLLMKKDKVDHQFESVIKYLKERKNLIDRVSSFTEEHTENEEKYVKTLRKHGENISDITTLNKESLKEIKSSLKQLKKFIKMDEIYPKFSKNGIYSLLSDEIILNEERFNYSIESYNKEAKIYNEIKSKNKVNIYISKIFKINDYEYYDE